MVNINLILPHRICSEVGDTKPNGLPTMSVDYPSKWQNPWRVKKNKRGYDIYFYDVKAQTAGVLVDSYSKDSAKIAHKASAEYYKVYMNRRNVIDKLDLRELAGHNLSSSVEMIYESHVDVLFNLMYPKMVGDDF